MQDIINTIDYKIFNAVVKYYNFILQKSEFDSIIADFDISWLKLRPKVKKGKYILEFPNANMLSNGERDIISFIVRLIKIEKKSYEKINNENDKNDFIKTNETRPKSDYAIKKGIDVPEKHYMLSLIYNEACHCKENADNSIISVIHLKCINFYI